MGINILSTVTRFHFPKRTMVSLSLQATKQGVSGASSLCPYSMFFAPAASGITVSLAVRFLVLMQALLSLSTIYGLAVLSVFGAFDDEGENSNSVPS